MVRCAAPALVAALLLCTGPTPAGGTRAQTPPDRSIQLALTGDIAMAWRGTPPNWRRFPWKKNPLRLMAPLLRSADLSIGNLETVLTSRDPQYAIKRYNLWAPPVSAQVFPAAGVGLVSTANNHIFDGRAAGVHSTLRHLRAQGLKVIGSGSTVAEARRAFLFRKGGACVAVVPATTKLNMPELGSARAAYFPRRKQAELLASLAGIKRRCGFVLVYIHWGDERIHFPPDRIRVLGRALVRAGADLVVGHHPHVLQGVEFHGAGIIVYSLGNFVFSNPTEIKRRSGLLWVTLRARPTRVTRLEMVPVYIRKRDYTPVPTAGWRSLDLLRRMQRYCRPFGTQVVLDNGRMRFHGPRTVPAP